MLAFQVGEFTSVDLLLLEQAAFDLGMPLLSMKLAEYDCLLALFKEFPGS
jgi:hypothetical protein